MNPNAEKQGFPAQPVAPQADYQYQQQPQQPQPPQQPMSPPPPFNAPNVPPQYTGAPPPNGNINVNYPPVQAKAEQYPPQPQQYPPHQHNIPPTGVPQAQGYYAPHDPNAPVPVQGAPMHTMQHPGPYAPPQQGYPTQAPGQQQYRIATPIPSLGPSPAPVDCPNCHERCMTNISYHSGNTTHAWAVGLCCLTGLFCFVPYLMNGLKDVEHRCGKCGILLATRHKSGVVDVHAHA